MQAHYLKLVLLEFLVLELHCFREEYGKRVPYWGREAAWFATVGYLIAEQQNQGKQGFDQIKNMLLEPNITEETQNRLMGIPLPRTIDRNSSLSERMLYLYKFCDTYCVPN